MTQGETLLNCPFCGGRAEKSESDFGYPYFVQCADSNTCAVQPGTDHHKSEAEAIAAWNQRTDPIRDELQRDTDTVSKATAWDAATSIPPKTKAQLADLTRELADTKARLAEAVEVLVEKLSTSIAYDAPVLRKMCANAATAITALRGEVDTLRTERDGLLAALRGVTVNCQGQLDAWTADGVCSKDALRFVSEIEIDARAAILAAGGGTERAKEEPKP